MPRIAITTECVADMPAELIRKGEVGVIYFDIQTDHGLSRDGEEIDATNIAEYMAESHNMAYSVISSANDYRQFFKKQLDEYDEVIHISISSNVSESYEHAKLGRMKLGIDAGKVHLVDSGQLSTGIGILVMEAVEGRNKELDSKSILELIHKKMPFIRTSFMCHDADYLYYNNRVNKLTMRLCQILRAHPVLYMKDGNLYLKTIYFGNYKRASKRYIHSMLHKSERIIKENGFLTYSGCGYELLGFIKEQIRAGIVFDKLWEQQASVAISSNCGPMTFGVIFSDKEE